MTETKIRRKYRVAIIGTASGNLTADDFRKMRIAAVGIIDRIVLSLGCDRNDIELVSGGAAWGDHVAVAIAPYYSRIHVYMPCDFDKTTNRHVDSGEYHWTKNPGRLSNSYHDKFSKIVGWDTQADFMKLKNITMYKCAPVSGISPFHVRNTYVAQADYMITFTPTASMDQYKGGTFHTWELFMKRHKETDPKTGDEVFKGNHFHVDFSRL